MHPVGIARSHDALADAHQLMADNEHPPGNMAVLVGAAEAGQGAG